MRDRKEVKNRAEVVLKAYQNLIIIHEGHQVFELKTLKKKLL